MNRHVTLFWSIFLCFNFIGLNAQPWKLVKDKNRIKVFTRKAEGNALKESRTVMKVNASVDELVAVLKDVENYKDWMDRCEDSFVIRKISPNIMYTYYLAPAPWPVSDRDNVARMTVNVGLEHGKVVIENFCAPDAYPQQSGVVRIPESYSSWTFTPKENGQTEVVLYQKNDPGGNIPDWLANSAVVDTPFKTMEGLREVLAY